jgi:hypothetical protein
MGRRTVLIFVLILSFLRFVKTNNAGEILTQIVPRESCRGAQVLINGLTGQVSTGTQMSGYPANRISESERTATVAE